MPDSTPDLFDNTATDPTPLLANADLSLVQHNIIKHDLLLRYRIFPLSLTHQRLRVAIADNSSLEAIPLIAFHTGYTIEPCFVDPLALQTALEQHCRPHVLYQQLESTLEHLPEINETGPTFIHQKNGEPVANYLSHLITEAITANASDIHLDPQAGSYRVRFRCHGLLANTADIPLHLAIRLITRLKILANVNIAEKRLPQDGRLQLTEPHKLDIRLSTCPTLHGEKMTLRLLDTTATALDITTLGMLPEQQLLFLNCLTQPQGLILVTGPTGSGKTMTLYAALNYLNDPTKHIITIEDPIEIELPGINQIAVQSAIGLTFANILRSILRQDPDILMIGEIRDVETATMAFQAAQTGHLVLATLHANDSVETLTRLQALGIDKYTLANSLTLVIAQRLIRRHHAGEYGARMGIFECLSLSKEKAQQWIQSNSITLNGPTLLAVAQQQVRLGITTTQEIKRVLGTC